MEMCHQLLLTLITILVLIVLVLIYKQVEIYLKEITNKIILKI